MSGALSDDRFLVARARMYPDNASMTAGCSRGESSMMPCMEKMAPLRMFAELPLSLSNALSYRSAICPCFEIASSSDTWVTDIQVKNDDDCRQTGEHHRDECRLVAPTPGLHRLSDCFSAEADAADAGAGPLRCSTAMSPAPCTQRSSGVLS